MSWENVRIGDFLKNRDLRFKPKDPEIKDLKRIEKIDFSGNIYVSEKPSNTDMILVKKGDLVISGINVEKGAMAVYQGEDDITATIHYSSYEFDSNKIDLHFLKNFLKSAKFVQAIKEQIPGGIKTEIKPKHLLSLEVEIPTSIDEQRKVVSKLQNKNTRIESIYAENTQQFDLLKKLRQQILQDAVQGKLLNSSPPREGEYPQGEGVIDYKKISNLPLLKTFRRELRSHLTPAEATLWTLLSNRKLQGRKFRRQHSVGNYILDFFCPEEKLAVELDGEVHMNTIAEQYDRDRDIFLQYTGIKVLRFENRMVFDLPESLLREIEENFGWDKKITTPAFGHPSLKGGEHEQMEDARVLLEKIRAEKQQFIAQGKIKKGKTLPEIKPEEIPFEIPDKWVWCRLGEVIKLISGQHIDTSNYNERGIGIPYLTGPIDFGEIFPLITKWTEKPKVLAKNGDILITVKGSGVGKTNLCNISQIVISRQLMAVRPVLTNRDYIKHFLDQIFLTLQKEKKGTGIPGIGRENILYKLFPLPPLHEQLRIVTKIEELMKLCDEMEQSIQQNQKYTQELLQVALKEALEPNTN